MAEPSWQDLFDYGVVVMKTRRPKFLVEEGDVSDSIIAGTATIGTAILARFNQQIRTVFLDSAVGDDLTALCHDRGVDRHTGEKGIGTVNLTRPTTAAGAGTIVAGTRVATDPDETGTVSIFTIDEDVVYGGADLSKTGVRVTCTVGGRSGNVAVGAIVRFMDPVFDATIVATNPQVTAGGTEEESDEDLRDRTRGFFLTQARGTVEALKFGAKEVDGVERVTVTVDAAGVVTVYVADADGNSNDAMVANVTTELENWRDAADVVYVTGGVVVLQAINVRVTVRTGTSLNALLSSIRTAIVSAVGRLNPGETLYPDLISTAVKDVDRTNIVTCEVLNPLVGVVPLATQLIRTNNGLITFTP